MEVFYSQTIEKPRENEFFGEETEFQIITKM